MCRTILWVKTWKNNNPGHDNVWFIHYYKTMWQVFNQTGKVSNSLHDWVRIFRLSSIFESDSKNWLSSALFIQSCWFFRWFSFNLMKPISEALLFRFQWLAFFDFSTRFTRRLTSNFTFLNFFDRFLWKGRPSLRLLLIENISRNKTEMIKIRL